MPYALEDTLKSCRFYAGRLYPNDFLFPAIFFAGADPKGVRSVTLTDLNSMGMFTGTIDELEEGFQLFSEPVLLNGDPPFLFHAVSDVERVDDETLRFRFSHFSEQLKTEAPRIFRSWSWLRNTRIRLFNTMFLISNFMGMLGIFDLSSILNPENISECNILFSKTKLSLEFEENVLENLFYGSTVGRPLTQIESEVFGPIEEDLEQCLLPWGIETRVLRDCIKIDLVSTGVRPLMVN